MEVDSIRTFSVYANVPWTWTQQQLFNWFTCNSAIWKWLSSIGCSDGHHRCIVEIEDKPMLLLSTTAPQSNSQPSSMQNIACIYLSYPSPSQKDLEIIVTQSFERPKNLFSAAIFTWGWWSDRLLVLGMLKSRIALEAGKNVTNVFCCGVFCGWSKSIRNKKKLCWLLLRVKIQKKNDMVKKKINTQVE